MVARVIMGQKDGGYGLFVSRPGQSVLLSSDYLMSTAIKNLQIAQQGSFTITAWGSPGISFSWSSLGFRPKISIQTEHKLVGFTYTSDNSGTATFDDMQNFLDSYWNAGGPVPTLSNVVYWSVLSVAF